MQSAILDVAIGLMFTYLVLSLLCSGIQEWIAHHLDLRAELLEKGIRNMLGNQAVGADANGSRISLADLVLSHGLVTSMDDVGRIPSYLSARVFGVALTDSLLALNGKMGGAAAQSLLGAASDQPAIRTGLQACLTGSTSDLQRARESAEIWFDETMERVSGAYKKKAQKFILAISIVVVILLNVDTIALIQRLWSDAPLRTAVAQSAARYAGDPQNRKPKEAADEITAQLRELKVDRIPIGYESWDFWKSLSWSTPIGWILSALAISLGAPFWFNALSSALRLTGKVPAQSFGGGLSSGPTPAPSPGPLGISTPGGPPLPPATLDALTQSVAQSAAGVDGLTAKEPSLSRDDIVDIQTALNMPTTGVLDADTRDAIRARQEHENLTATGLVDRQTLKILLS